MDKIEIGFCCNEPIVFTSSGIEISYDNEYAPNGIITTSIDFTKEDIQKLVSFYSKISEKGKIL